MSEQKKIILTGDRPTGPLHLGHYIGSLKNRVALQHSYNQFILIADLQALASKAGEIEAVRENVTQVVLDYLAVGIDPNVSTMYVQSMVPETAELTVILLNLVTVARLQRNPTVKEELESRSFKEHVTAGFLMHPVHQAADITLFKANLVPVGEDQLPLIEQCRELVRSFNNIYGPVFVEPEALVPEHGARLVGVDGKAKMSKSLGNAIYLSDSADAIRQKVMSMYTDPNHLKVSDPGNVEGNAVFAYLDIFDQDKAAVEELKAHYRRGGLGDVVLKKHLEAILQDLIAPIRIRRAEFAKDPALIMEIIKNGTDKARAVAQKTMQEVKQAMRIDYW